VGETPQLVDVLLGLTIFYNVRAEHQIARELAEQGLHLAQRQGNPALLVAPHAILGACFYHLGAFPLAWVHLEQGLALYAPQQHPLAFHFGLDPEVRCCTYLARGLWLLGYPDQTLQRVDSAQAAGGGVRLVY
jgi:hypothetical protein